MLRLPIGKQTQVSDYIIEAYKSVRLSTINLEMLVVNKEVKRSTVWLSSRKQTFARHKDIISNVGMGQPRTYSSTMARDVTKWSTINALPRLNKKMRNLTSSRRSLVNRPKWCVIALRWSLINRAGAVISVAGVPQNSKACTKMQCVGMTFRETYTPRSLTLSVRSSQIEVRRSTWSNRVNRPNQPYLASSILAVNARRWWWQTQKRFLMIYMTQRLGRRCFSRRWDVRPISSDLKQELAPANTYTRPPSSVRIRRCRLRSRMT